MKGVIVVVCVIFSVSVSEGVTYFVSKTGSNSNSCATAQSGGSSGKLTLNGSTGGISCLSAGDTLLVQDGVYNEQVSDTVDSEHPGATAPPSGTSLANRTVIKAENYRGATLNKSAIGPPVNHVVFLGQRSYVSIEDFILDSRGHGTCVWIGPGNYLKVKGNYITNCGNQGIYGDHELASGDGLGFEILDNEIVNVSQESAVEPGGHAIYSIGRDGVTSGNYIHGACPFYGIHFNSETGGITGNTIANNRVVACEYAGILNQGSNTVVMNNLLEGNRIGIQANATGNQFIYNNTIFDWRIGSIGGNESYGILDGTGGTTIRNNLILQQRDVSSVRRYIYYTGSPTLSNNICDGVQPQNCQINVSNYATVVIDGFGGNLQLVSGGAAVNTGFTLAAVLVDRLGVSRPQGSGYDVGAYELVLEVDSTPPTVSVTAPLGGSVVSGSTVSVTATATDNIGVVGVQFKVDGGNLLTEDGSLPYGVVWNTLGYSNGSHVLTAVARDAAGNSTTSAGVSVTVSNGVVSGGVRRRVMQY